MITVGRGHLLGAIALFVLTSCDQQGNNAQFGEQQQRATTSSQRASAKVVRVRLVPFTTAQGGRAQMVLVNWTNTGTTTIRAVDADIIPYDALGNKLASGASDYAIYAVSDSSPGISPGETYIEPDGKGFTLVPGFANAARVEVNITEVVETGAY